MIFQAQQRKWRRVPAGFEVAFEIGEKTGTAAALDVSSGGLFVGVDPPPRVGETVHLTFRLPGSPPDDESAAPVRAIGQVLWCIAPPESRHPGCAVSIVAMPREAKKALHEFVQQASFVLVEPADPGEIPGIVLEIEAKTNGSFRPEGAK